MGYRIADTDGRIFPVLDDEYCKVSFSVPPEYNGIITISFKEPWYWEMASIISLIAWIGLAGSYILPALKSV